MSTKAAVQRESRSLVPGSSKRVKLLLDELAAIASRPLERARALPPAFYTDPGLYELEIERIWRRSWLYAGRAEDVASPGDWLALDLLGEPVVVVRGRDGTLRALSRVCPHRFMDVLADEPDRRGNRASFTCPYHSWTFETTGKLSSAPLMADSVLFAEEADGYCLAQFALFEWHGFVFVNFDREATPPELGEVEQFLGNYDFREWRRVDRIEWGETEANWKLVVDNGREAYHHQGTHRATLEPLWPARMVEYQPTRSTDFFLLRMFVSPEAAVGYEDGHYINPTLLPAAPRLTPFERSSYMVVGLYPGFIVAPGPDAVFTLNYWPTGATSHDIDIDIFVHESHLDTAKLTDVVQEARAWISEIQREDSHAIQAVQRSVSTRAVTRGGALSSVERSVWTFQRYLANRLAGTALDNGGESS